jgi:ABC-type transport system involved in cytochrome bd biosynthesis fused ATPase/permease subunit
MSSFIVTVKDNVSIALNQASTSTMWVLIACIVVELVVSLVVTHLQKNIQNTLTAFAFISMCSMGISAVKNIVFENKGFEDQQHYRTSMMYKYDTLDYISKQKNSHENFQSKLSRACHAHHMQISWGLNTVVNTSMTMIGLVYIVMTGGCWIVFPCLIVVNGLCYYCVTSGMMKSYTVMKEEFRKQRTASEETCRLLMSQIHNEHHSHSKVREYLRINKSIDDKSEMMTNCWIKAMRIQQLPNFIILMMVPYIAVDFTQFSVLVMVFMDFNGSISSLSNFFSQWQHLKRDIQEINDFWTNKTFTAKPQQYAIPDQLIASVSLPNGVKIDELQIVQGDIIRIVGSSGCGKTTLINALLGHIDGAQLSTGVNPLSYSDEVVCMAQNIRGTIPVSTTTIRQVFDNETSDEIIIDCLRIANAMKWFEGTMKEQLDEPINNAISGGEKTRLCLAITIHKVMISKAKWLILDEPEQGVDPEQAPEMLKQVFKRFPQLTIFIITHLCDCRTQHFGLTTEWKIEDGAIKVSSLRR